MMKAHKNEIDSDALGGVVLEIEGFTPDGDFVEFEREYVARFGPRYAFCKVPIEMIRGIHALEEIGFRFVEFQVRSELQLRKRYNTGKMPYIYRLVESQDDLQWVLDIAEKTFTDDRYANDPF